MTISTEMPSFYGSSRSQNRSKKSTADLTPFPHRMMPRGSAPKRETFYDSCQGEWYGGRKVITFDFRRLERPIRTFKRLGADCR